MTGKSSAEFEDLAAPARRALDRAGIRTLTELSAYSEREIAGLHGMGPNALARLAAKLEAMGLAFKP